jgi:hypothetical protein
MNVENKSRKYKRYEINDICTLEKKEKLGKRENTKDYILEMFFRFTKKDKQQTKP